MLSNDLNKTIYLMEKITKKEAKNILPADTSVEDALKSTDNKEQDFKNRVKELIYKLIDGEASIDDVIDKIKNKNIKL